MSKSNQDGKYGRWLRSPAMAARNRWRRFRGGLREGAMWVERLRHSLPTLQLNTLAPPLDTAVEIVEEHRWLPTKRDRADAPEDLLSLLRIVRSIRPKSILELGTAHGNTVANLCRVCDAKIWTVNALPEQIDGDITTVTLTQIEIGCVYRNLGYSDRVTQVYENTANIDYSRYLASTTVDLAIIDACHDTAFVISDFLRILPVLAPNAVVLFHDTHPSRVAHLFGSYDACVKLRRRGFDISHIEGTWWGYYVHRAGGSRP